MIDPPAPPAATPPRRRLTLALTLVVALAGCSLPESGTPDAPGDPSEAPIGSSTPDPARDALVAEIRRLEATTLEAREALAEALEADGPGAARSAADRALTSLVTEEGTGGDDARPLFPSVSLGRDELDDAPDQLTVTLTAARDVGGSLGNAVVDLLRDPVAGDLGAWQRDAAGVLDSIEATTREATDLEGLEAAVSELPGLGTQAIAWTMLVADAGSTEDARAYAERGVASLDVVLVSLDLLGLDEEDGG